MKNIEIREFKLTIEKFINEKDFPFEIKRMIIKEIYEDLEQKSNREMLLEIEKRDKTENKIEEE